MADKRANLESVIRTAIASELKELHTCLPAIVTKVNMVDQLIDAQIVIKRKMSGRVILLPPLVNVPIRFPRSQTFSITFPIEVNDHVLILFCERSIDNWLINGGQQDAFDTRKFSLSDAFAIPSMYPQTDKIPNFNTNDLEIKTNSGITKIVVKASEDIDIITDGDITAECDNADITCDTKASVTCQTAEINATTGVTITTPLVTVNGNLTVNGVISSPSYIGYGGGGSAVIPNIQVDTSLQAGGVEHIGHVHPQGVDSDGDTQQNTGGPQ